MSNPRQHEMNIVNQSGTRILQSSRQSKITSMRLDKSNYVKVIIHSNTDHSSVLLTLDFENDNIQKADAHASSFFAQHVHYLLCDKA